VQASWTNIIIVELNDTVISLVSVPLLATNKPQPQQPKYPISFELKSHWICFLKKFMKRCFTGKFVPKSHSGNTILTGKLDIGSPINSEQNERSDTYSFWINTVRLILRAWLIHNSFATPHKKELSRRIVGIPLFLLQLLMEQLINRRIL
jgi:hypothetical protein